MKLSWTRFWSICVACTLIFGAVGVQMVRIQNIPGSQQILDQSESLGVTPDLRRQLLVRQALARRAEALAQRLEEAAASH